MVSKLNKDLLNTLIKKLEKDIDGYRGDYGTLENRLEDTLNQILNILKVMNGEIPFEEWYIEELKEGGK